MRKRVFYPKLALGNLWRNKSTYLPYLLACVVSVFTFYTLLAINFNGALDELPNKGIVQSFTVVGTIILALFATALIFYTNSFLIKRRKTELGMYSILGMEKKNIAILMFFETFFIGIIALVLGLASGMLLSRLLFVVLLRMARFPVNLNMPISPEAIVFTAVFFAFVFLLTLLTNLWQVRLAKPIELMAGAKQGEREPKSSWVLTVIGLLALGAGYVMAIRIASPMEAIALFLVAAFLVIIGTFCLFTSGSIAVLKLLRRNKNYYYKANHFISVSGMIYRMKQNAAGLASICILSCMVLVTVSSTVSLQVGAEDSLHTQYPREIVLRCSVPADGDVLLAQAEALAAQQGVQLERLWNVNAYSTAAQRDGAVFTSSNTYSMNDGSVMFTVMPLADYNAAEGKSEVLAADEALLFCTGGSFAGDMLELDGIGYRVRQIKELNGQNMGAVDLGASFTLVLPDMEAMQRALAARPADVQQARPSEEQIVREVAFDTSGTEEQKTAFSQAFGEQTWQTQGTVQFIAREESKEGWYAMNGGFLFLGVYFGILFMLAAALIIYYKQISEGYDDCDRYEILQKVGMSDKEVRKTIQGQISAVFALPLLVAVIHIAIAYFPISKAMVIFGITNQWLLVATTAATVLVYALVYLLVYRRTAKTYFRIVRRQPATK